MTTLWLLWGVHCFAWVTDRLYVQPTRRRRALLAGRSYEPGTLSFALAASLPLFTVILLLRAFIVDVYRVPSPSMEPTLAEDSLIFFDRTAYGLRSPLTGRAWLKAADPAPGDVIVFHYPREPRTTYVKRVLAGPGDRVRIRGDRVEVNADTVYAPGAVVSSVSTAVVGDVAYPILDDPAVEPDTDLDLIVPDGHFFALGDNLDHSDDSRTWGFVGRRHLIGRVIL